MGGAPVSSYSSNPFYRELSEIRELPFYSELSEKYEKRSGRNERLQERLDELREKRATLLGREPKTATVAGDAKTSEAAASPMAFNELLNETEKLRYRNENMRERAKDLRAQNQAINQGVKSGLDPKAALQAYEEKMKAKAQRRRERRQELPN